MSPIKTTLYNDFFSRFDKRREWMNGYKAVASFVTLAELGNYHAAAEILCLTQSALTKQIQALSTRSGSGLFRRGRHGSMLTLAGKHLYAKTGELLKHSMNFRNIPP